MAARFQGNRVFYRAATKRKSELAELEKVKLQSEIDKLKAETSEILRPSLSRPGFWASIVPIAAAAVTLFFAWNSNFFDAQEKYLDARKLELSAQTETLKIEKTRLDREVAARETEVASKEAEVRQLSAHITELQSQLKYAPLDSAISALLKNELDNSPFAYDKSAGRSVTYAVLGMDDQRQGIDRALAAIEKMPSIAHRAALYRSLVDVAYDSSINDAFAKMIGESSLETAGWDAMIAIAADRTSEEPTSFARARCDAVERAILATKALPEVITDVVYGYGMCSRISFSDEAPNALDPAVARHLVRLVFERQVRSDWECANFAAFLKSFSVDAADLMFAVCLSRLDPTSISEEVVENYEDGNAEINEPPTNAKVRGAGAWRDFGIDIAIPKGVDSIEALITG